MLRVTRLPLRRRAFTLVEMLVVIAIIAVLAALLLPAIQAAREAARRAQCSNSLRNLSLAMTEFDSAKGYLPASRMFWQNSPNRPANWNTSLSGTGVNSAPAQTMTWVHQIMPHIDQTPMFEALQRALKSNLSVQDVAGKLNIVLCPSDETDDVNSSNANNQQLMLPYSQISYGVNCGVPDNISLPNPIAGFDWKQNGVFNNRLKGLNDSHQIFQTTLGDITDGATNTIMITENSDLEEWNYAPTEFHVGVVWDDSTANGVNQQLNKYLSGNSKPDTLANMYTLQSPNPQNLVPYGRPLSNHPNGFMVAFCGNNVKFVSENINYATYAKLMTHNGKNYLQAGYPRGGSNPPANILSVQIQPVTDDQF